MMLAKRIKVILFICLRIFAQDMDISNIFYETKSIKIKTVFHVRHPVIKNKVRLLKKLDKNH